MIRRDPQVISGHLDRRLHIARAEHELLPLAIGTWTGAPFRALVERAGVGDGARYVRFDSFDRGYYNGRDLALALPAEVMRAMHRAGARDSMLDTIPGGEMARGDSTAEMELLERKR